jgi:hypothetical protein
MSIGHTRKMGKSSKKKTKNIFIFLFPYSHNVKIHLKKMLELAINDSFNKFVMEQM